MYSMLLVLPFTPRYLLTPPRPGSTNHTEHRTLHATLRSHVVARIDSASYSGTRLGARAWPTRDIPPFVEQDLGQQGYVA